MRDAEPVKAKDYEIDEVKDFIYAEGDIIKYCWDLVPNSLFIPPIRETYPDRSLLFWS